MLARAYRIAHLVGAWARSRRSMASWSGRFAISLFPWASAGGCRGEHPPGRRASLELKGDWPVIACGIGGRMANSQTTARSSIRSRSSGRLPMGRRRPTASAGWAGTTSGPATYVHGTARRAVFREYPRGETRIYKRATRSTQPQANGGSMVSKQGSVLSGSMGALRGCAAGHAPAGAAGRTPTRVGTRLPENAGNDFWRTARV